MTVARGGDSSLTDAASGGRLSIEAGTLAFSGDVRLSSGQVSLSAERGDLTLDAGARIDVSGRTVGTGAAGSDGGTIALRAAQGDVVLNPSARLDLGGSRGGSLEMTAAGGRSSRAASPPKAQRHRAVSAWTRGRRKPLPNGPPCLRNWRLPVSAIPWACGCAKEISRWRQGRA